MYFKNTKFRGVSSIRVAFSREIRNRKIYVQNLLSQNSAEIFKLLGPSSSNGREGYFYICGDAKYMARDVQNTLIEICITEGNMNETEAKNWVKTMRQAGRFLEDVWS